MIKKYFTRKALLDYMYETFTGSFLGFVIGMWATNVVSWFFETRNIYNLWGFKARKTVISKEAFENIEWLLSIIFGFFIFEIYNKFVKDRLRSFVTTAGRQSMDYLEENGWLKKAEGIKADASGRIRGERDRWKD